MAVEHLTLKHLKIAYKDIVKQLVEREDITLNTADKGCRTPLLWVARHRHAGIVRVLLERGMSHPTLDNGGRALLL